MNSNDIELDFDTSKRLADALAHATLGESTCLSWYDKIEDREAPANVSECHEACDIPGYIDYAANRGGELKIVFNDGIFVFCYRPLGEFSNSP